MSLKFIPFLCTHLGRFIFNPALLAIFCLTPGLAYSETLILTESKVMEMALEKNLGVKIARAESQISETSIQAAKSLFDTFAEFNVDHLIDKSDVEISVFGTDNRTTNWNFGVSKLFPYGTQTSIEWRNERNTTNSPFATFNPSFDSTLAFSLEQPLLKNFLGMQDRGHVDTAKEYYKATNALSQRKISESVFSVVNDYWWWITNRALVAVTELSYIEAEKFEKLSKQKEAFGLHESTDVLAAKANKLQILNQLRLAKTLRDNSLGRLRHGLDLENDVIIKAHEQIPFSSQKPDLDNALSVALANRLEYLAAKNNLEARKIELSMAKNRKWPELDLIASLEINGVDSAYGQALSEMGEFDHPQFFIGTEFRFPFENRLAKSEKRRAEIEKVKILLEMKDLENNITQNVEEEWRAVINAIKTVQTNRTIEHLQKEKWQEELKKYRTGRSSSDIVIRYQEDYRTAQRVTYNSLFNYRMAVLGLELAKSTFLL